MPKIVENSCSWSYPHFFKSSHLCFNIAFVFSKASSIIILNLSETTNSLTHSFFSPVVPVKQPLLLLIYTSLYHINTLTQQPDFYLLLTVGSKYTSISFFIGFSARLRAILKISYVACL